MTSIQHTAVDRTPYVYVIKFDDPESGARKWYVGSRYRKGCHPSDLLVTYKSSSIEMRRIIDENDPSCFSTKIIKILNARNDAVPYEQKVVLKALRMGHKLGDSLINLSVPGIRSQPHTERMKEYYRVLFTGRKLTPEWRKNIGDARRGVSLSAEAKRNISSGLTGKKKPPHTEEHKRKIAQGVAVDWKITSPDNVVYIVRNLSEFCRLHGLTKQCMSAVARKVSSNHKGWLCERLDKSDSDSF